MEEIITTEIRKFLGYTKFETGLLNCFLGLASLGKYPEFRIEELTKELGVDRTTVQKAIVKLVDDGYVIRNQVNMKPAGYHYTYKSEQYGKVLDAIGTIVNHDSILALDYLAEKRGVAVEVTRG